MNKRIGIYPGSFDPITFGHLDIIERSIHVVDELIVAVSDNDSKKHMISIEDRKDLIDQSIKITFDKNDQNKIIVESFDQLLVNYVHKKNSNLIIRGLRAVSDFEYEFLMTGMNRKLDNNVETIFLMSSEKYHFISSRFIKEIHRLGGDISTSVPKPVLDFLSKI